MLWPDSQGSQARTNLRRELHHLRAVLDGNPCLEVDTRFLCWRSGAACVVDLQEFREATLSTLEALRAGLKPAVEHHSARAFAAYRGSFLPGYDDDWVLEVRQDLARTQLDLCDRVTAFWLSYGDPAAAVAVARRRILLEPLEESGYRTLMRAQREAGDRAGAMRTYHQCATLLERELAVGPSAGTRAEFHLALAGVDRSVGGASESADDAPWSSQPELVGRAREQGRLLSAWREAQSGCRIVTVVGAAGVGKTRLVAALADAVRRQDAVVVEARCFAGTSAVPLAPVADWLRSPALRMAIGRLDPVWRAEVERLVPEDHDRHDPAGPGTRAEGKVDAWQRLRFFEGLARALRAVDRPLLLTVEDLQWCDKATMSWLSFLSAHLGSDPVLVVATARDDEVVGSDLSARLDTLQAAGQVELHPLTNLSAGDVARLAEGVLRHPVADDELDLLMSGTGGNPFYLLEALRRTGATPGPLGPADLRGVLDSRLARLPELTRDVVSLAACVGRDFTLNLLIEASDLDEECVVRQVDELWRQRILEEHGRGYDFAHHLLRDAAYGAISPPRRWLLHRRLAQALELLYADRPDVVAAQLAEQYDRSGRPERALPFYERAARAATAVFAHAESVRSWQRCLELVGEAPASSQRDRRELALLGELLPPLNAWRGYASTELEGYERRQVVLGERLGLTTVRCTAAIALFTTTFVQGHIAESHRWGKQALTLSAHHPDLTGQAHLAVAGSALSLGSVPLADRHFRMACDGAGESDFLPIGTRTAVHAQAWWAHAKWLSGDIAGAAAASSDAVQHARDIDHPYSLAVSLAYASITLQLVGDTPALRESVGELSELCEHYGFAYYGAWSTVIGGWAEGGMAGLKTARAGIDALELEGSLSRMPYWLSLVAELHLRDGNPAAAVAVLDAATSFATEHDDRWWLPEVLRARAALSPGSGSAVRLHHAMALARSQSSVTLLERCRADLDARPPT
ncbi:MAG: AAA family ATPase [Terracoccus sp.]